MHLTDTIDWDEIEYHPEYTVVLGRDEEGTFGQANLPPFITFTSEQMVEAPQIELEVDMPATWDIVMPWSPELEDWVLQHIFIFFDGNLILRGKVYGADSDDDNSTTNLSGDGVVDFLKDDGEVITFENIPHSEAIKEYVDLTDFQVELIPDTFETVDREAISHRIVSTVDWEEFLDVPNDVPVGVGPGRLEILQSCWVFEGRQGNPRRITGSDINEHPHFSNGDAGSHRTGPGLRDEEVYPEDGGIDFSEFQFDVEYTIPAEEFTCYVRHQTHPDEGMPEIQWSLIRMTDEGTHGRSWVFDKHDRGWRRKFDLGWRELVRSGLDINTTYSGPDLTPGTYRVRVEVTDSYGSFDREYLLDVVAVMDRRYVDTSKFDTEWDEVHEPNGYLDGPQLGGAATAELLDFQSSYSVNRASIRSNWNNTSESQNVELSNDGGDTYLPGAGGDNTDEIDVTFTDTYGTTITPKVTLDWFTPNNTPQNATPRFKFQPQRCTRLETFRWTDTRPVIDRMDLNGSHYGNLVRLHSSGGRIFHALYDVEHHPTILSLMPGDLVEELDDVKVLNHTREIDARDYANVVRVHGAGGRTFTWFNPTEIERRGEHWHNVFEEEISDFRVLRAIGRPILRDLVEKDNLVGTMSIVPRVVTPGISYTSEYFDGEPMLLHRASFEDVEQPSGSLDFKTPDELADMFKDLRREMRRSN